MLVDSRHYEKCTMVRSCVALKMTIFAVGERDHRIVRLGGPPKTNDHRVYSFCSNLAMVCSCILLVPS